MAFRWKRSHLILAMGLGLLVGCGGASGPGLASLEVTPSPVDLTVGATRQLVVIGVYSDGTRAPVTSGVTFSSSEVLVAGVSAGGMVTGVAVGSATITASASGKTSTVTVAVTRGVPRLVSIALTPSPVNVSVGRSQQLAVTGTYSDSSTADLTATSTFSSSTVGVATVSSGGLVNGVSVGTATITATHTASGKTASASVDVAAPTLVSIALTPSPVSVAASRSQPLTVTGTYSDASTANLTAGSTFVSSDAGVATVSGGGLVAGVAVGSATVTATHTASGKTATVTVNVTPAPTLVSIALTPSPLSMVINRTRQLVVTGTYSDSVTADVTASSSFVSAGTGVATVSTGGLVTAVVVGSTTITATASGKSATVAVTVTATPVLVSIAVTPSPLGLAVSATQQLTVTGTYNDQSTANITLSSTFASSASGVATVSTGGLVTAVALGTATITVTASGLTATVTVNVATSTGGRVFVGDYDPGVSFKSFGGSALVGGVVTRDTVETREGRASLRVEISATGDYAGGAFVASAPRDLRVYNALTFWAKASVPNLLNVTGIGNDAGPTEGYAAESLRTPLTGTWTRYIIPIPVPAKLTANAGLFHFADGPKGYIVWLNDIQYETLTSAEVGPPTDAHVEWSASLSVPVGTPYQLAYQPNTVTFTTPPLPNMNFLTNVSFRYFTLVSSAPALATVSADGLVTGLAPGTANITATLGSIAVAGQAVVTVTVPLAVPTTTAAPPGRPAGNALSLYNSSGTYSNVPVDSWAAFGLPGTVVDFSVGTRKVKQYPSLNYVGVQFLTPVVDASSYSHLHLDVWTPNGTKLGVQLVNDVGPNQQQAQVDFNAGTTPAITTGTWIALDIPLSSFTGTAFNKLGQLLFLNNTGGVEGATFYVDNVYFWR